MNSVIPQAVLSAAALFLLAGCGKNKFEKEVETEAVSVKLTRQVQDGDYDLITAEELKKLEGSDRSNSGC